VGGWAFVLPCFNNVGDALYIDFLATANMTLSVYVWGIRVPQSVQIRNPVGNPLETAPVGGTRSATQVLNQASGSVTLVPDPGAGNALRLHLMSTDNLTNGVAAVAPQGLAVEIGSPTLSLPLNGLIHPGGSPLACWTSQVGNVRINLFYDVIQLPVLATST
jgi:hypothetical protein